LHNVVTMESQNATKVTTGQQAYIDFCATGGFIVDDNADKDETIKRISAEQLGELLGVDRRTLYRWRDSIPNFWDLVAERRDELFSQARMTRIYNAMFKEALKGNVQAAKLMLNQGGRLKAERSENHTIHEGEVQFTNVIPRNANNS
jgi:hypothetical protein